MEVDGIGLELERQKEENRFQHEQIVSLTAKLQETELRLAQLMAEHDEVAGTLHITRDNQNALADELAKFKDRYAEVRYIIKVICNEYVQSYKITMFAFILAGCEYVVGNTGTTEAAAQAIGAGRSRWCALPVAVRRSTARLYRPGIGVFAVL